MPPTLPESVARLGPYIPKPIKDLVPQRYKPATAGAPNRAKPVIAALGTGGVGAEIGVWKGELTKLFLRKCAPHTLHLVDPWLFFEEADYAESLYGGAVARNQHDMDVIYQQVERQYSAEVASGQVQIHRAFSTDWAKGIPDDSLDWIYLDADHTHDAVAADLRAFYPKVKAGGIIAGDDYGTHAWFKDGVFSAVNEFVRTFDFNIELVYQEQFVLRKV